MCVTNNVTEKSLEKWRDLIIACKNYYIDSLPTGMSDFEFDILESRAASEDGFFVRDYVFQTFLKGTKTKNSFIEKIKKTKVEGKSMLQAITDFMSSNSGFYCDLKYDGSSIAIYLDPTTGIPKRIVTVGNLNLDNYGVDQTWKLMNFLPKRFPKGIVAIQTEALVDINRLSNIGPETARQKANGLINSKYCESEVNNLLTLRAYRYYTDDSIDGQMIRRADYREVLRSFETVYSRVDGHVLFAPADVWTVEELFKMNQGYTETDKTITSTGYFLNDGWVVYDRTGICLGALKFAGAGSGTEAIKTTVRGIQWNSQVPKGKDSWSANILIDPIQIKGCTVKKPSAGSVGKMIKKKITPGAIVSIIMANSTIPMVGESFKEGNGDFMWPTCSCGYTMSEKDVYGSLLKCGNPMCAERLGRMDSYVKSLGNVYNELNLNKLLVIDRFKWEDTDINIEFLLKSIENNTPDDYYSQLRSYMKTDLQVRNLDLVWKASFIVLRNFYEKSIGI